MNDEHRLQILFALADRAGFGTEIMERVYQRTGGKVVLRDDHTYPILHDLERKGILRSWKEKAPRGRDRRYYELTSVGLRLVASLLDVESRYGQRVEGNA